MSRIYKALKKAEQESGRVFGKKTPAEGPDWLPEKDGAPFGAPEGLNRGLVSILEPRSMAAEQFRKLRSHLWRLEQQVRTLMVTSPLPKEGKTLVTANLAIALAQGLEDHVLLVDCDFRRPALHTLFGLRSQGGLADYLKGRGTLGSYLLDTPIPKLTLLPLGTVPPNPSELLASREMRELVREVRDRYRDRYVLFDATPVLPTTESVVLGALVDGVIVVVRAGKTPGPSLARTVEALNGSNVLGIVFNGAENVFPGSYAEYLYYYNENGNGAKR